MRQVKGLPKRTSILLIFLLSFILIPAFPTNAEETLKHDGKLRFKQERIGENDTVTGQETSANLVTELEKVAPDLFKEQTKEKIETKQREFNETYERLEEKLFTKPHEENVVLKETESALFANDYTTPKVASEEQVQNSNGGLASTPILASLIGVALAICGGIYVFMRKAFD